jgi:hypothetical protein
MATLPGRIILLDFIHESGVEWDGCQPVTSRMRHTVYDTGPHWRLSPCVDIPCCKPDTNRSRGCASAVGNE